MKKSIKVLVLLVALFVFFTVSVGAYYRSGWHNCKSWTCGRYNNNGVRIGHFWNGKHAEIRSIQVRTIQVKSWWSGKITYRRAWMGMSYTLNHRDLWVRMSEWETVTH